MLVIFLLARPQEFIPLLTRVPLLYLLCGAALSGYVLDLKLRRLQPVAPPPLAWAMGFLGWALLCTAIVSPATLVARTIDTAILAVVFIVLAQSVQRLRTLQLVAAALIVTATFLSFVCFHQGISDNQCVALDPGDPEQGTPDDRPCENHAQCNNGDGEAGIEYRCERVGLFGTFAVQNRVRYRGELHDPNEVALTICAFGFSFLLAFMLRYRNPLWRVAGTVLCGLIVVTVFFTQSRGGLIVMMVVPGTYLVKRYGAKMIVIGGALAMPVLMLGGRSGSSADESTMLRYEAWAAGLDMFKMSPLFGVGQRNYSNYHFLTAHNSYVLTLAELGFVGMVLFVALLTITVKTLVSGLRELEAVPEAATARAWGMALLASMIGLLFQIHTLSFAYHSVTWILLGVAAAWASAVGHHRPHWRVRLTGRDLGFIIVGCAVYATILLPIFLRYKGAR